MSIKTQYSFIQFKKRKIYTKLCIKYTCRINVQCSYENNNVTVLAILIINRTTLWMYSIIMHKTALILGNVLMYMDSWTKTNAVDKKYEHREDKSRKSKWKEKGLNENRIITWWWGELNWQEQDCYSGE